MSVFRSGSGAVSPSKMQFGFLEWFSGTVVGRLLGAAQERFSGTVVGRLLGAAQERFSGTVLVCYCERSARLRFVSPIDAAVGSQRQRTNWQ